MRNVYRSGQIGLMLLLVTGLVVSLVLSIASRVITDTSLSRQEKENNESFAIAESGVEQALLSLSQGQTDLSNIPLSNTGSVVSGNFDLMASSSFDMYLKEGETAQIDLTGTPSNIVLKWGKDGEDPGTCTEGTGTAPAAVEVSIFLSTAVVNRAYYNPNRCAATLATTNNFAASSAISGTFVNSQNIALPANAIFMRVKPLYNGTTVNVSGTNLKSQLYKVQSFAAGADSRSDIEVARSLDAAGSVFDFALFSNTTIVK